MLNGQRLVLGHPEPDRLNLTIKGIEVDVSNDSKWGGY